VTAAGEQVDILLVDDRAENLLALEAILEPLGQRLVRAQSGEDALRPGLTAAMPWSTRAPMSCGFTVSTSVSAAWAASTLPTTRTP
jgi:response regulator RpfG family c-di-GMP phosphodiesterase